MEKQSIICKHKFGETTNIEWAKMPVKICKKCNHYEFAHIENLQKNIQFLSGYRWE